MVDVGCGDGALVRALAHRGARAIGIDVRPPEGEAFLRGAGEALPLGDDSADAVVMVNSLHHVPRERMDAALAEALRVAPVAYVQEPLAEGPFFALVALVDDETEVRALAQEAIARSGRVERELRFDVPVSVGSLAELRERIVGADPQRAERFDTRAGELSAGLAALGPAPVAPSVAHVLRRP